MNYKETIRRKADFNYLHKKQSGGSGQFARVVGYIEPSDDGDDEEAKNLKGGDGFEFINECVGTNIPPEFISSCEKGAKDAMSGGALTGNAMTGVRVVVTDGQAHAVDSSDMAFRIAMAGAVREATPKAGGVVMEPIMALEVTAGRQHVPRAWWGTRGTLLFPPRPSSLAKRSDMLASGAPRPSNQASPLHSAGRVPCGVSGHHR